MGVRSAGIHGQGVAPFVVLLWNPICRRHLFTALIAAGRFALIPKEHIGFRRCSLEPSRQLPKLRWRYTHNSAENFAEMTRVQKACRFGDLINRELRTAEK
jgi:hypothetical protein